MTLNEICNNYKLPVFVAQTSETKTLDRPFELLGRTRGGFQIVFCEIVGFISSSPVNDYEVIE